MQRSLAREGRQIIARAFRKAEVYVFHLIANGVIRQLRGIDTLIPGQIGLGESGKDLWAFFRRGGGPVGIEIKYTGRAADLPKGRFYRAGGYQLMPELETEDWIRWALANEELAESVAGGSRVGRRWIPEGHSSVEAWKRWVRRHGPAHFRRLGNRFVVVVSPAGRAGVAPEALRELGNLNPSAVIRVAEPEGF